MDRSSKILTDKWKDIIESINVNGYSRKVECVNCFRMNKWYVGYPEIEICYKVIFDFRDPNISDVEKYFYKSNHSNVDRYDWGKKLEETFTEMFFDPSIEFMPMPDSDEVRFENSKVDYMNNQGYRFIVQFYPGGFISDFREEKLKELGL
jgi:hypothetical protein